MTLDKRFGVSAIWLFAALAMVFAPALDSPELAGFKQFSLNETLGPRILAPSSVEAVAQDDRPAGLVTHAHTALQGLLVLVILHVALVAAAVVALRQKSAPSQVPESRKSTRGPPPLAS